MPYAADYWQALGPAGCIINIDANLNSAIRIATLVKLCNGCEGVGRVCDDGESPAAGGGSGLNEHSASERLGIPISTPPQRAMLVSGERPEDPDRDLVSRGSDRRQHSGSL